MKKERKMSKKRSKHIILNSRKEFVKRTLKIGINPIKKDEVKLDKEIKKELVAKKLAIKEKRKLRDELQLKEHIINMNARELKRAALARQQAEEKQKAREETKVKKDLKKYARDLAKAEYINKKADKKANTNKLNSRTKRKKIQLESNKALENAA